MHAKADRDGMANDNDDGMDVKHLLPNDYVKVPIDACSPLLVKGQHMRKRRLEL